MRVGIGVLKLDPHYFSVHHVHTRVSTHTRGVWQVFNMIIVNVEYNLIRKILFNIIVAWI